MATNRPRYTVSVDNELFEQIENFRFEHRFNTRSEATVELIRMGLKALEEEQKKILLIINKPNVEPCISPIFRKYKAPFLCHPIRFNIYSLPHIQRCHISDGFQKFFRTFSRIFDS